MTVDMIINTIIPPNYRKLGTQFFRFTCVGAVGTGMHYIVLVSLVEIVKWNPVFSSLFGFITGACINYCLNYVWTFRSTKDHRNTVIKFFAIAFVGLIINTVIMSCLTSYFLILNYLFSQIISTGTVLIWNFCGNRFWTFR